MGSEGPGGGRLRALVLPLFALALGACIAGGCAASWARQSPQMLTHCGEIKMDRTSARRLQTAEHRWRREVSGRLVVFVRFRNVSDKPYLAKLRVKFKDRDGMWERGAYDMDEHEFPPGETSLEWTSYTRDAARYEIEVRKGRFYLW